MTSHKSRQEEACETAGHERSELAGGETLAGEPVVQPASFSLLRCRNERALNRITQMNETGLC